VIEPLISKQWFVTMEPLAEKALHAVENGQLTILPERFEKVLHECTLLERVICLYDYELAKSGLLNVFLQKLLPFAFLVCFFCRYIIIG
jgi:hypothetical protein